MGNIIKVHPGGWVRKGYEWTYRSWGLREGSTAWLINALTTVLDCLGLILKKKAPITKGELNTASSGQYKGNKSDGSFLPTEVKTEQLGDRTESGQTVLLMNALTKKG